MTAIISDIHGNLPALESVLKAATSLGCNRFISLGDVVGYYSQPDKCIDLLRDYGATNVMGNHDYYVVSGDNCLRSNFVSEIIDYHRKIISDEQKLWLAKSNDFLIEQNDYFMHGGNLDKKDQYLYRVSKNDIPLDARNMFTGHTHVQVLFDFGNQKYCNPGSVGQPRDGDSRAAFATVSNNSINLHRVEYDINKTAFEMKKAGYEKRYYENLFQGAQIGGRIDKVIQVDDSN